MVKQKKLFKHFLISAGCAAMLAACGKSDDDDKDAAPEELSTAINSASLALADALPTQDSSELWLQAKNTIAVNKAVLLQTYSIDKDNYSNSDVTVNPVGGVPTGDETQVTIRGFLQTAMDPEFTRTNPDDEEYEPTLFGKYESAVEVLVALSSSEDITFKDGLPVPGEYEDAAIIKGGESMTASVDVAALDDTTNYDVGLTNFVVTRNGQSEELSFRYYLKNTATQLNMLAVEDVQVFSGVDSIAYTILSWNRSTGEIRFEHVSDGNEAQGEGNANLLSARLYRNETGGTAQMFSFDGKSDNTVADYTSYSLIAEGGKEEAEEASVSLDLRTADDTYQGLFCVNAESYAYKANDSCASVDGFDLTDSLPSYIAAMRKVEDPTKHFTRLGIGASNVAEAVVPFTDADTFWTSY